MLTNESPFAKVMRKCNANQHADKRTVSDVDLLGLTTEARASSKQPARSPDFG